MSAYPNSAIFCHLEKGRGLIKIMFMSFIVVYDIFLADLVQPNILMSEIINSSHLLILRYCHKCLESNLE